MQDFISYVYSFYGPGELYPLRRLGPQGVWENVTKDQIVEATKTLRHHGENMPCDSIDREKVRDILIHDFGFVFPT